MGHFTPHGGPDLFRESPFEDSCPSQCLNDWLFKTYKVHYKSEALKISHIYGFIFSPEKHNIDNPTRENVQDVQRKVKVSKKDTYGRNSVCKSSPRLLLHCP